MKSDKIEIFNLKEDAARWEALIERENAASATDENVRNVVAGMYWEKNREKAFSRFCESLDFRCILEILSIFDVSPKRSLCEIGGGSGQLAWALAKSGYENVELLEPNDLWTTGTGYLETVLNDCNGRLRICNDLTRWYASEELFETVVTRNCVHHFPNIAMTAACIRQKLEKGGPML